MRTRRQVLAAGMLGLTRFLLPTSALAQQPPLVDVSHAINWTHPLAWGHEVFLLALPGTMYDERWRNLTGGASATLGGLALPPTATSGWNRTTRRTGWAELRCNGTTNYIELPDSTRFTGMPGLTVAMWVKFNAFGTVDDIALSIKRNTIAPWYAWYFAVLLTSNVVVWQAYNTAGTVTAGGQSTTAMTTGVWRHLIGTTPLGSNGAVYINGIANGTTDGPLTTTVFDSDDTLAFMGNVSEKFINGACDGIQVIRRGLSARQALALYREALLGYPTLLTRLPPQTDVAAAPTLKGRSRGTVF